MTSNDTHRNNNWQRLTIVPLTWKEACKFSDAVHRHLKAPPGGKWAIGVCDEHGQLRGVALCGRPIARHLDDAMTIEVNRTATDGCPNANSALYGACWRIATAMGYRRIVTYNQERETGSSLQAAGYEKVRLLQPRKGWADSSIKLKHKRDKIGSGGVARTLWSKSASNPKPNGKQRESNSYASAVAHWATLKP